MTNFIELNRLFVELDLKSSEERDDGTGYGASLFSNRKTWSDILDNRCTVIISEAGTGKSEELRNRAKTLRAQGNAAFFCRLDLLTKSPFEACIDVGTRTEFEAWRASDAPGYFFLDSVDEARLTSPKDFEVALLNFVAAIEPYASRATTVISTRVSAWQTIADPAMIASRLGVAIPETTTTPCPAEAGDNDEHDAGESLTTEDTITTPAPAPPKLSIVEMAPLNEEQVRIFATARGVVDVDQFMNAIERADADLYAGRPSDLQGLVQLWKDQQRIGRYREVVEGNIKTKLREENPAHQTKCIDDKKALEGAQRLAAAVTFTHKSSIRLPQSPINSTFEKVSVDAMDVLSDWTPEEVKDLLGRALFDESLYGTVRFHHRTAREYSTAKWLGRMLDRRKSRRAVQSLLFGSPYGTLAEAAVPSMKPIIGWLALDDQQIRDKAIDIDPRILLEFGDASSLDIGTRGLLLKKFANLYRDRQHTPLSLHLREVRRLGDPQMSPLISKMLREYRNHEDVRQLLLRIVREGRIENCGEAVIPLALATDVDSYTQSYAVQAIGSAGTPDQRCEIKNAILTAPEKFNQQVLAAAVESIADFSCDDVGRIAEAASSPKPFSSDHLDISLKKYSQELSVSDKRRFLGILISLIQRKPLKDENYCRLSVRYAWLLPLAFELAKQILTLEPLADDPVLLTTLSMVEQSKHLQGYHGEIQKDLSGLLAASRALNHALFWYEVDGKRQRSGKPVTDFWHPGVDVYSKEDFPLFAEALKIRSADDKQVALSALVTIYVRAGKPEELLEQLRTLVAHDDALQAAFKTQLSPAVPPAVTAAEKEHKQFERRSLLQKQKYETNRNNWIESLKADPTKIGDLSIAAEGKVWNNTSWLFNEIRKKKSTNRWTVTDWQILEADFGKSVAEMFRDFCINFWRLYEPKIRSESSQNTNQTPLAVIVGLSGLTMEFQIDPSLPSKLSDDEVQRAVRYALEELNELPPWFSSLFRARPQPVTDVLVSEMQWELNTPHVEGSAGYILSRIRWSSMDLGAALRKEIVKLILNAPDTNPRALMEALTIILRDPKPVPEELITHARARFDDSSTEYLTALWLAFLICADAELAVTEIEKWIEAAPTKELKESRVTRVLNNVWGGRFDGFNTPHNAYQRPDLLLRMLKLSHTHVRIEDDLIREGGFSPGERDHAERARGHLFEMLYKIPGRATYNALMELSSFHTLQYPKDRTLALAEERASLDLEQSDWNAKDIEVFAAQAERPPDTQSLLFELAQSRLDDLKLELEEGDESEASLLRKAEDEYELRRAIANRLRNSARQFYDVASEEEYADRTRTDIRLHNPNVKERIPIEVKIAGKWRSDELRERLQNQLIKQYMREAQHGLFLVVNRGAENDSMSWTVNSKRVGFAELVEWLQDEAHTLVAEYSMVEAIEVVGIDLTARDRNAVEAAKARALKMATGDGSSDRKKPAGRRKAKSRNKRTRSDS